MGTLRPTSPAGVVIRLGIVALTIATATIHLRLGGLLFTLNGLGYLAGALAMVIPLALAVRFRWLVRLGLIGYTLATIIGWALTGPRFELAYVAKAIEVVLVMLLVVEVRAYDGNPLPRVRRLAAALRPGRA
jgi:hypothetical protein